MPNTANGARTHGALSAQTVTPLTLTTTDGVSHAHCVKGYVTSLRMPCCAFNQAWTTQMQTRKDTCTHSSETSEGEKKALLN